MPEILQKTVVRKITASMVAAQKDYAESSLDFVCDAPEYLLTVYIYQALHKARGGEILDV